MRHAAAPRRPHSSSIINFTYFITLYLNKEQYVSSFLLPSMEKII